MAKALYRKYRPKTLAEVVGQEQVTETLANSLKQGRISHAYLFVGPRGTGKTSVARIFAHEINHFPYELEDDYVDIIEIDGASNRGIEDIRELREKATIAPSEGKFKVYIIDEVHMLTTPAFNALLKTLEEPPAHVVFLLATTDVHKVPKTILSRTQNFTFKLAEPEIMQGFLRKVAETEGIKISDEALEIVRKRGGGSFRDSLSLLDQISALSENEITRDLVVAAMGLPEDDEVVRLLETYTKGDLAEISAVLQELLSTGTKPELLTEGLIRKIVAEPRPEWLGLLSRLPAVAAPFPEAKLLVALTVDLKVEPRKVAKVGTDLAMKTKVGSAPVAVSENETAAKIENTPETTQLQVATDETAPEGTQLQVADFDWADFKRKVQEQNDAVAQQLNKAQGELEQGEVHIYPERKIVKRILENEKNLSILRAEAGGHKIVIHDAGEKPQITAQNAENERKRAVLSDIMGGEVVEDGGENPF